MSYEVVGHRILIRPKDVEEKTESGLVLVKDTVEKERIATEEGTVLGVGPACFYELNWPFDTVKIGDRVVYSKYGGKFIRDPEDKDKWIVIINDQDILLKVQ